MNSSTPTDSRKQILVADDDPVSRQYIKAILGTEYAIVEVEDGVEAIAALEAEAAIACAVLDDLMPQMTGLDVVRHIRASGPSRQIPAIVITARDANTATRQAEGTRLGVTAYLNKPFTRTQLLRLVETVVMMQSARKTA